jgi:hypothetical protein
MSTGKKVAIGLAALAAGGAVFLFVKKSSAATPPAPSAVVPTVPPSPGVPPNAPPAAPPVPTNATIAKVLTHDPPPSGDLNLFDAPNGNRIGGAEKNSIVRVNSNDGTFANITTNNTEGRYVDQTGFVHAKFLGDPSQDVAQGIADTATAVGDAVRNALGF